MPQVATITLPAGSALAERSVITVASGTISAARVIDDRRVGAASFRVPVLITADITAAARERVITVAFSEPVNGAIEGVATFSTSAANPGHYQIARPGSGGQLGDPGPLPGGTTIVYVVTPAIPATSTTPEVAATYVATITLPVGSEFVGGEEISVIGGRIGPAVVGTRRVEAASFRVPVPVTTTIAAEARGLVITVTFTAPVNRAADGEARFATSALNPVHYQINAAALPADTTIISSGVGQLVGRQVRITLPVGSGLPDSATVSVLGGVINVEDAADDRQAEAAMLQGWGSGSGHDHNHSARRRANHLGYLLCRVGRRVNQ